MLQQILKSISMFSVVILITACTQADVNNTGWTPQYKIFDGVEMALVPAGCFMMGYDENDPPPRIDFLDTDIQWFIDQQTPLTEVCFDEPFWIDRYEVTNAQFRQFNGVAKSKGIWTADNRPRDSISWHEAKAFCELRDARLPSEAEWEYAARGPDSLFYPWGNTWNADYVVNVRYSGLDYEIDPTQQTVDVGSKPSGASWVGALDMAGNVWEWTNSAYEPYPYISTDGRETWTSDDKRHRVIRGGSWRSRLINLQTMYRGESGFIFDYPEVIGFRCARAIGEIVE